MKGNTRSFHSLLGVIGLLITTCLYAEAQPKFNLTPTTATTWHVAHNGSATVGYCVTNNTEFTRQLTMTPIPGVIQQSVTGAGSCATPCGNPFTLASGQSCLLTLGLDGSSLPVDIHGGPVICKTKGPNNNSPDPFLCSEPSTSDRLNVTRTGYETVNITVTPSLLDLVINNANGILTVTNTSTTVTATNIQPSIPAGWGSVTFSYPDCVSIAPQGTCTITITPGATQHEPQSIAIAGSHTTTASATVFIGLGFANISVNPSFLMLIEGNPFTPGTVTVTNNSTTITAYNIEATLPPGWTNIGVTSPGSSCAAVAPADSCTLQFTPQSTIYLPPPVTTIAGDNTNSQDLSLSVVSDEATITVTPTTLALGEKGASGSFTVHNASLNPITATNISTNFGSTALATKVTQSAPCANLAQGADCQITFTSNSGDDPIQSTSINIFGNNTQSVPVTVSVTGPVLSIEPTSLVLAGAGIFDSLARGTPPAASRSRDIVITNSGSTPAFNVNTSIEGIDSAATIEKYTPVNCTNVIAANGGTCTLKIKPLAPPTAQGQPPIPNATYLHITGNNVNHLDADITVLNYGNLYQGGYIFALNDLPGGITGSVYTTKTVGNNIPVVPSGQLGSLSSHTNGMQNTTEIYTNFHNNFLPSEYAAAACYEYSTGIYTTGWYLPAICQIAPDAPMDPIDADCGPIQTPQIQNIYSNYLFGLSSITYLSSTTTETKVWNALPTDGILGLLFLQPISEPEAFCCARDF